MIDYEMLCQTIEDWRAGRRPSIDLSATSVGAAEDYGDVGGYDDGQYAEPQPGYEDEGEYAEGEYAEPQQGYESEGQYAEPQQGYESYEEVPAAGYDDYEYDGAPAPVAAGGTSPVDLSDEELEDDEQH